MDDLKPCPCCSASADYDTEPNGVIFSIWCSKCSVEINHAQAGPVDIVARWNTRPTPNDGEN